MEACPLYFLLCVSGNDNLLNTSIGILEYEKRKCEKYVTGVS
jgi:hypothetical protein